MNNAFGGLAAPYTKPEWSYKMVTKQQIHALVDQLPEETLPAAKKLLQSLHDDLPSDPFLRSLLLAPEDDEPLTDEQRAGIEEALQDVAEGRTVSHDEARRILLGNAE